MSIEESPIDAVCIGYGHTFRSEDIIEPVPKFKSLDLQNIIIVDGFLTYTTVNPMLTISK